MTRLATSDKLRAWLLEEIEVWRAGGEMSQEQAVPS